MKKTKFAVLLVSLLLGFSTVALAAGDQVIKLSMALSLISKAQSLQQQYGGLTAASMNAVAPTPLQGGSGEYVSPFTSSGELTSWAQTGLQAALAGAASAQASEKAASAVTSQLASKVPFGGLVGGMFGKKAKETVQQAGPVMLMGGWDQIRQSSDFSFNSLDELAMFMHANNFSSVDYAKGLAAAMALYPELQDRYLGAVENGVKLAQASQVSPVAAVAQAQVAANQPAAANTDYGYQANLQRAAAVQEQRAQIAGQSLQSSAASSGMKGLGSALTSMFSNMPAVEEKEAPQETAEPAAEVAQNSEGNTAEARSVPAAAGLAPEEPPAAADEAVKLAMAQTQSSPEAHKEAPPPALAQADTAAEDARQAAIEEEKARQVMAPVDTALNSQTVATPSHNKPWMNGATVEQRLDLLMQARVRGEMSGDAYLAERRRILYGN